MTHDFKDSLAKSHKAEDFPFWEACYRKFFPTFETMVNHRRDGFWQRDGIDRSITLSNSKQILIDEKARWKDYGKNDIGLEYISNDVTGAPGWVCKDLRADWIAYAVAPIGKCYLMPVIQMQIAWTRNHDEWMKKYPCLPSQNNGYRTWSCYVLSGEVFSKIGACLRCEFDSCTF